MLGKRIRGLREARGMSAAELSRAVGIKQPSLWEIENGETKSLRADTLMRLAAALRTNPVFLWSGRGNPLEQIDPNLEEAEAVATFRRLTPSNRTAWLAIGATLLRTQPVVAPNHDDPFPAAPKPSRSRQGR